MNVQDLAPPAVTACESTTCVVLGILVMVAVPVIPVPVTAIPTVRPVLATATVVVPFGVLLSTFGSPCGPRCTQVKPLRSWKVKPL